MILSSFVIEALFVSIFWVHLRNYIELPVGDYFILLNGRDPAHLRDEISASWPGAFGWEYLIRESGEISVKITKLKAVNEDLELPAGHACSH